MTIRARPRRRTAPGALSAALVLGGWFGAACGPAQTAEPITDGAVGADAAALDAGALDVARADGAPGPDHLTVDAVVSDRLSVDAATTRDAGGGLDVDPGAALVIEQISLASSMGEAALVVGPDGTSVLIDTGGDGHADEVIEAIERRLGARQVDWVVITHYHYDHTGGFDKIFAPSSANGQQPVSVTRGLVSRGPYDLNGQFVIDDSAFREYCELAASPGWAAPRFDLCTGPSEIPCDGEGAADPWPASGCPGLLLGDLEDGADDDQDALSYIELGGGARLTFFHANGFVATRDGVEWAGDNGVSLGHGGTGPENERGLGGVIQWGDFSYSFHGDTGSEIEAFIAARSDRIIATAAGPPLLPSGAHDVSKLSHHGISSATSAAWVDWLFPADGAVRNAVVGTNPGYFFSPAGSVLDRVAPRLGAGWVWVTHLGTLPGEHARRREVDGAVVVQVRDGGAGYQVLGWSGGAASMVEEFVSTSP